MDAARGQDAAAAQCGTVLRAVCVAWLLHLCVNPLLAWLTARVGAMQHSAVAIDQRVYICGGSDGWKEVAPVDCFDVSVMKWLSESEVPLKLKNPTRHGTAVAIDQ